MKKKIARVSIGDIALASGDSKATVSYVLHNKPGPSQKTRERVLETARRLGYTPDARINSWMARVRDAKAKDLLPIAWLNTNTVQDAWHKFAYLSPYRLGMEERCNQLGYRLEEIWTRQPGMTMQRISQILYQRGIEGVVVTPHATHIRLQWDKLAGVALGAELLAPRLHRVSIDGIFNLLLALKILKRFGYRRIGVCLSDAVDRCSSHVTSALVFHLATTTAESKLVPPLFIKGGSNGGAPPQKQVQAWMRTHQPDVIVCHDNHSVQWLEEAGYRVPQQVGVVHLALDDDVLDWAGIYSNKRAVGRTAAELVISLVHNRQFGVPTHALETIVRGTWQHGRTLLIPKPK